jgi:hypothetical protein
VVAVGLQRLRHLLLVAVVDSVRRRRQVFVVERATMKNSSWCF